MFKLFLYRNTLGYLGFSENTFTPVLMLTSFIHGRYKHEDIVGTWQDTFCVELDRKRAVYEDSIEDYYFDKAKAKRNA